MRHYILRGLGGMVAAALSLEPAGRAPQPVFLYPSHFSIAILSEEAVAPPELTARRSWAPEQTAGVDRLLENTWRFRAASGIYRMTPFSNYFELINFGKMPTGRNLMAFNHQNLFGSDGLLATALIKIHTGRWVLWVLNRRAIRTPEFLRRISRSVGRAAVMFAVASYVIKRYSPGRSVPVISPLMGKAAGYFMRKCTQIVKLSSFLINGAELQNLLSIPIEPGRTVQAAAACLTQGLHDVGVFPVIPHHKKITDDNIHTGPYWIAVAAQAPLTIISIDSTLDPKARFDDLLGLLGNAIVRWLKTGRFNPGFTFKLTYLDTLYLRDAGPEENRRQAKAVMQYIYAVLERAGARHVGVPQKELPAVPPQALTVAA